MPESFGTGLIKLTDGTKLKLSILVVDVREAGFSPFGGVNFDVKTVGGVATVYVPEELREAVKDKPLPPGDQVPEDGWEIIDIAEKENAVAELIVNSSKGEFKVRVEAEPVMAARNMNYRNKYSEPIYWLSWVIKVSWRPLQKTRGGDS